MTGWTVTGSRDCVRIVRPGGIVVVSLSAEAGRAVYDGLRGIYGEDADAKANLVRVKPMTWWRRFWRPAS